MNYNYVNLSLILRLYTCRYVYLICSKMYNVKFTIKYTRESLSYHPNDNVFMQNICKPFQWPTMPIITFLSGTTHSILVHFLLHLPFSFFSDECRDLSPQELKGPLALLPGKEYLYL